jgi:hypothetical protein
VLETVLGAQATAAKLPVDPELRDSVARLKATEEGAVVWRCVLEAVEAADRLRLEIWIDEARVLFLSCPARAVCRLVPPG